MDLVSHFKVEFSISLLFLFRGAGSRYVTHVVEGTTVFHTFLTFTAASVSWSVGELSQI